MKLQNVLGTIKNRMLLHAVLWRLERLGIVFRPYYLIVEGEFVEEPIIRNCENEKYAYGFLEPDDISRIEFLDGDNEIDSYLQRMEQGHLCFGLKRDEEIVGCMWCDLDRFNHAPCSFELKPNEAYLYDASVSPAFRGRGLAPYMRFQCYRALASRSRDVLYSYSDVANTPAIRFKQKLGARFLKLNLYIQLWNRFSCHWTLWNYPVVKESKGGNG